MSYIKNRVAKTRETDATYRAAYDEEMALIERQTERRSAVMGQIASIRKSLGVTQQEVASALKISQARVSQIESGTETVSVDYLLDFLDLLNVQMVLVNRADASRPIDLGHKKA